MLMFPKSYVPAAISWVFVTMLIPDAYPIYKQLNIVFKSSYFSHHNTKSLSRALRSNYFNITCVFNVPYAHMPVPVLVATFHTLNPVSRGTWYCLAGMAWHISSLAGDV